LVKNYSLLQSNARLAGDVLDSKEGRGIYGPYVLMGH
jgi:hypothetical protein